MSKPTLNGVFKLQTKRLNPTTAKRGTISAINAAARTVDVRFIENPQTVIRSIPLAGSIDANSLQVGMQVGVDTYNETAPYSMVITYVIGQQTSQGTIIAPVAVPISSSAAGQQGQMSWDTSFFYICIANNVWRRVSLSTF